MSDVEKKEMLRDNYPSNSKTKKLNNSAPITSEAKKPKIERVVKGQVKTQKRSLGKRLADLYIEDDSKSVGTYIFNDILIPAGKSLVCDIVGWGGFAEMLLYGSVRGRPAGGSSSIRRSDNRSVVNYSSYSRDARDTRDRSRTTGISNAGRARHDFAEVVIPTIREAEDVRVHMLEAIEEYGQVTVADFYDLVGITGDFPDNDYGWTDLRSLDFSRTRDGYILNLPRTQPLD